ncbi:hypothetical protein BXT86_03445 [candidate division WOR-3 bacterium 4484_100]|uniref:Glucose-1-phosphate thymidylyltransferase n=1 Tax=candidate division WOR-3 bacterium 4484_100 TaxID=1936077 RepID=A0A1V4QF85_UNCW3|nr:MAG: hypothetical protein BXT86_03445 [candidate division WOR-3 bacterium 4484_100]
MKVIIYEEDWYNFYPLANLIPQPHLYLGAKTIIENNQQFLTGTTVDCLCERDFFIQKPIPETPTLYLSSKSVLTKEFKPPENECRLMIGGRAIGFVKYRPPFPETLKQISEEAGSIDDEIEVEGLILEHPWDFIRHNGSMLLLHLQRMNKKTETQPRAEIVGDIKDLYVAPSAEVHPFTTFDLTQGPIYIDEDVRIGPFTAIYGPCYIGKGSMIERARIVASTFGPVCRIGGEIDSCIFQGFSNKYHQGFIGHSYIGQWVNLGALTTNSDLKNNYREVRVLVGGKKFNTGMLKLGCFIGDHTKLGIGTLIPTGAVIGSFVNYFGGGMMPGYLSCFKWANQMQVETYELEKAIETARVVMARRGLEMDPEYEGLIRKYFRWRVSLSQ